MNNDLISRQYQLFSFRILAIYVGLIILFFSYVRFWYPAMDWGNSFSNVFVNNFPGKMGATDFWFEQSLLDKNNPIRALFNKTPHVNEDGESVSCHACGVVIGVVTYKQVSGKWEISSTQSNLGEYGSWGNPPNIKAAKVFKISSNNIALLIPDKDGGQGRNSELVYILSYSNGRWRDLGSVVIGENIAGNCFDEPSPTERDKKYGTEKCWGYKGELSVKNEMDEDYPDLILTKSGTEEGSDVRHVVPFKREVTYVFNGQKYVVSKAHLID